MVRTCKMAFKSAPHRGRIHLRWPFEPWLIAQPLGTPAASATLAAAGEGRDGPPQFLDGNLTDDRDAGGVQPLGHVNAGEGWIGRSFEFLVSVGDKMAAELMSRVEETLVDCVVGRVQLGRRDVEGRAARTIAVNTCRWRAVEVCSTPSRIASSSL
jgi:hypothetical protein